ncbi:DUF3667 domain-containing protein [soil metagenome]
MSGELETAALASTGGWLRWKRKHADVPVGTPCANCATPLMGTYCHVCGQEAEDFHRSSWKLFVEAVESLLHLDGRMVRTLPNLVRRPGELTRDYLDGKRAYQVQPFRMFLVILLVVLFVGHLTLKSGETHEASPAKTTIAGHVVPVSQARAEAEAEIMADTTLSATEKQTALAAARGDWARFGRSLGADAAVKAQAEAQAQGQGEGRASADATTTPRVTSKVLDSTDLKLAGLQHWAEARISAIRDDPERFALILEIWLHRVAVLALPVSALMLTLLFAFNRRFFVFDHLIFSMHSLSFQLLLLTVIFLASMLVGGWAWWLLLAMPVHLFVHMKGTYQRSTIGTVARMSALFVMTTVTFSLLALLWLYLGFNEMAGH